MFASLSHCPRSILLEAVFISATGTARSPSLQLNARETIQIGRNKNVSLSTYHYCPYFLLRPDTLGIYNPCSTFALSITLMQTPTCTGMRVRSTKDAHVIFQAVNLGIRPMVTRRLDTEERRAITSGCVFVWEERSPNSEVSGVSPIVVQCVLRFRELTFPSSHSRLALNGARFCMIDLLPNR